MLPQGRTALAVTSLPDGEKRYQNDIYGRTTTHMTPDEIHQLGLREMDRIQAEMTAIAKKEGFADLASFRAPLKTNPKYMPTSAEQILDDFRRLHRPDGAQTSANSSPCFPSRRSRSRPFPPFNPPPPLTT